MKQRVFTVVTVALALIQVALVLLSWIVATLSPSLPLRSLLGGEGLRWFFGTFVDNVASPLLAWLVLCSMAYGALVRSGLCKAVSSVFTGVELAYRQRHALYSAFVAMLAFVAVVVMLAFVPHAPLLGLSGSLFPSAFSASLVALSAFAVIMLSCIYGAACGTFCSIGDFFGSLYAGIVMAAPLYPLYVLAVQLYWSVRFVFAV